MAASTDPLKFTVDLFFCKGEPTVATSKLDIVVEYFPVLAVKSPNVIVVSTT